MAESEKILILGGTKEAAELAAELTADGHDVTTSLAGRTAEPEPVAGKVRIGGFSGNGKTGVEGLADWLAENGFTRLIDATHPFAKRISANAEAAARLTGIAFESVEEMDGSLPLLAPMSIIAGRIAVQVGTHLLHQPAGGKGKLLGGLPSTDRGKVVVLGAGAAGGNSAALAAAGGANVIVFDKRPDRLAQMMALGANVTALYPYEEYVARELRDADLVVGAVLVPSARAPRVVTAAMVKDMEPGSVLADISIDQGGCFETSRPTTWKEPTYVVDGVTHFAVTNMPGAVPQTSSQAISAAILPYVQRLASGPAWRDYAPLKGGINVDAGKVVHPALEGVV